MRDVANKVVTEVDMHGTTGFRYLSMVSTGGIE